MADPIDDLEQARMSLGLSVSDLWLRYFALGGMCTALEIDATLFGALHPNDHDHDMLAAALNECLDATGAHPPLPYSGDELAER